MDTTTTVREDVDTFSVYLQPEESIGYSAGIEQWLFDNQGMINLSYFRNDIDNKVLILSLQSTKVLITPKPQTAISAGRKKA